MSDPARDNRSEALARNVAHWDGISDEWLEKHSAQGGAWGNWRIPETELRLLGDVAGLDVLELGCGSGGWSLWLAERGARVVGVDPSTQQLDQAQRLQQSKGFHVTFLQAPAEQVPLADASFDLVWTAPGSVDTV